jgi:hypothetical protein
MRRKGAYEALHPETKNGAVVERDRLRQIGEVKADRFTADTASKTGQSERVIQRDASRPDTERPARAYALVAVGKLLIRPRVSAKVRPDAVLAVVSRRPSAAG